MSEFSLVAKLARLIDDGKVCIVIPELIRAEWDGCKKKIATQISNEVVEARRSSMKFVSFMDEIDFTDISAQVSSGDPISTGRKIAAHRINAVESILDSDASIRVLVSDQAKTLAIEHALGKKAPFRMRNSMADALIFFAAVEWVNEQKTVRAVFVTHNTKDFSDAKRADDDASYKERLAPDLQSLVENNGMTFGAVIGRVLNDIEQAVATDAEIERGEAVVAQTRLKDNMLEECISGIAIAKLLEQQKKIEGMTSGGAIGNMLEQQKKFEEMISGGAAGRMLEKIEEMTSGGTIGKMLEQQKKFEEMTSGGAVGRMLEQIKEMTSGGAVGRMLEQQKKIEEMTSGGAISRMLEQQKQIEEITSGGAISRMLEQQMKFEEMLKRFQ